MQVLEGGLAKEPIRVLIADDDPVMRSLVGANLTERIGHVTEAADGQEAWTLLLERTFDLALIDLSMPGIDGFTLIRCMRAHPRTQHMPIVVITSSTDQDAVSHAFEAGATSFLTKPVNWALFGHHIDYLVRSSQGSSVARANRRQAEAVARAKDAVIAALASRVRHRTSRIVEEAEDELDRAAAPAAGHDRLEFVARVLNQALSIEDMLDDVLAHLQTVTEQIVVDDQPVPVMRLVRTCADRLQHLAEARQVRIEIAPLGQPVRMLCEEEALACALSNLLRNAIEHAPPGSLVYIGTELRSDNILAFNVDDQGPGADLGQVARCLAPLGQRNGRGKGGSNDATLGLPMAKAIAQAHGGTVEVTLLPSVGTRASLILPADIVEIVCEHAA